MAKIKVCINNLTYRSYLISGLLRHQANDWGSLDRKNSGDYKQAMIADHVIQRTWQHTVLSRLKGSCTPHLVEGL
jgi:hypothetical protein